MNYYKAIFLITIISQCITHILGRGSVALDDVSFAKVVHRFPGVLVKFDVAFPYGDKHDIFENLAEQTGKNSDLLLAQVGVKDYGEKENEGLAAKYNIKKEDFPVVKLFLRDTENPINFDKEFTGDNLKTFVRDNSNIYIGLPGCLEKFDKLAKEFINSEEKQKSLLKKAEDIYNKSNKDEETSAKVYVAVMKKIIDQGKNFVEKETQRVANILKGKLAQKKQTEMQERLNILKAFSSTTKDEL